MLISKSDKVHLPAEFRPIAITNTVGKILFSIISARLEHYMVSNKFIDNTIQKGFLSEMPGCLEHAFTLYEFLRDAKREQRQIVVTWIDLANAYGSVRHNLIQFALNWYHIPIEIQELIFNYYEKLQAKIQTKGCKRKFKRKFRQSAPGSFSSTSDYSKVVSCPPSCSTAIFSSF